MEQPLFVTRHAIDRFRERVEPCATLDEVVNAIHQISSSARVRSQPRRWCRLVGVRTQPGSRYLYSAAYPGVCLVVRGNAVVTVFSRKVCTEWRKAILGVAA